MHLYHFGLAVVASALSGLQCSCSLPSPATCQPFWSIVMLLAPSPPRHITPRVKTRRVYDVSECPRPCCDAGVRVGIGGICR